MNLLKIFDRAGRDLRNGEKAVRKATESLGLHGLLENALRGVSIREAKRAIDKMPEATKAVLKEALKDG
jgi:hypothetical protein